MKTDREARKKRQRKLAEHRRIKSRRSTKLHDLGQKKFAAVQRSLGDLLPENAAFEVQKNGTVKINFEAPKSQVVERAEDVAKRLNIPLSELNVTTEAEIEEVTLEAQITEDMNAIVEDLYRDATHAKKPQTILTPEGEVHLPVDDYSIRTKNPKDDDEPA